MTPMMRTFPQVNNNVTPLTNNNPGKIMNDVINEDWIDSLLSEDEAMQFECYDDYTLDNDYASDTITGDPT